MEETEDVEKDYEALKATYDGMVVEATAMFKSATFDLEMMAPKKVNWDLKARLAPQLRTLQRRTQRALADMARENVRGAASTGNVNLNISSNIAAVSDDDDDDL